MRRDEKLLITNTSISNLKKWKNQSRIEGHWRRLYAAVTDKLLGRRTAEWGKLFFFV